MAASNIEQLRLRVRSLGGERPAHPKSVIYIMSRDQRVQDNHALLAAQTQALKDKLPLVVGFVLLKKSGYRAREHYEFMLDGLHEVAHDLKRLNISFDMRIAEPDAFITLQEMISEHKPSGVYFDFSPLRGPLNLHKKLAETGFAPVFEVDTHNIIPVWQLSPKQEVGAYTIRPKIHKVITQWLLEPGEVENHPYGTAAMKMPAREAFDSVIQKLPSNGTKIAFQPGEKSANAELEKFVTERLERYAFDRNDATKDAQSNLSPFLHYGHISSLRVALRLLQELSDARMEPSMFSSPKLPQPDDKPPLSAGVDALLEEMIVRKELSDNFCFYNPNYDSIEGAPNWAKISLDQHRDDPREHIYSYEQFAQGQTHDELWNASQRQLIKTSKLHGYMRMYWAKKVLEWTKSPEQAIDFLKRMNDFYSNDGGDPNGYVGILWSVAGLHDRPWFDRPVYGKIRYMNQTGAAKRFDTKSYFKIVTLSEGKISQADGIFG